MAALSGGALYRILENANFTVLGGTAIAGVEARLAPVPSVLTPAVRDMLTQRWPNGLYAHQADGLIESSAGRDICLATSTASGKSLVFMSAAADALQRDPTNKVLAIYPARALIQDQAAKWAEILGSLGFHSSIIDGGVKMDQRVGRLRDNHVILMTPDVLQAGLMSNLSDRDVIEFVRHLHLLILDETHVYEGVF